MSLGSILHTADPPKCHIRKQNQANANNKNTNIIKNPLELRLAELIDFPLYTDSPAWLSLYFCAAGLQSVAPESPRSALRAPKPTLHVIIILGVGQILGFV